MAGPIKRRKARLPVTLSGTGNSEAYQLLVDGDLDGANVRQVLLRQPAGGGMTAFTVYLVTNGKITPVVATLAEEDIAVEITPDPADVVASATVCSVRTAIAYETFLKDTLTILVDATSVGAWSLTGYVDVEV